LKPLRPDGKSRRPRAVPGAGRRRSGGGSGARPVRSHARDHIAASRTRRWHAAAAINLVKMIVLDMDSSVSPTYGDQEGTAYHGHFGCTCYHPPFVFDQFGDLERCALRPGNLHSADGWREVLEPVVARLTVSLAAFWPKRPAKP
jgi:hypothetical protein